MSDSAVERETEFTQETSETQTPQATSGTNVSNAVIGVFDTHTQAEQTIKTLESSGFSMQRLSIIGKGYHTEEYPTGFCTFGDRVKTWGSFGVFWGSLWGLLFATFFWIPRIGAIADTGSIMHLLVSAVTGAVLIGGVSVLGAALASLGQPKKAVIKYQRQTKADRYLVIVHATPDEVGRARELTHPGRGTDSAMVAA